MGKPRFGNWDEAIAAYGQFSEVHHRQSTRSGLTTILRKFGEHIGRRPPHTVSPNDVQSYQAGKVRAGGSYASTNRHIRHLSAFFTWLEENGWVDENPISRIRSLRVVQRGTEIPAEAEIAKLTKYLSDTGDHYYLDLVRVVVNTGLRLGEALNIKRQEVILDRGYLEIMDRADYFSKPRVIRLNSIALPIFRERIERTPNEHVWSIGGRIPHKSSISHGLTKRTKLAGSPGVTWESLRHFFGHRLVSAGCRAEVLGRIMGLSYERVIEVFFNRNEDGEPFEIPPISL